MRLSDSLLPLFARAAAHGDRLALIDDHRRATYRELLDAADRIAAGLLAGAAAGPGTTDDNQAGLDGARVALLLPPGFNFVAAQWGIWRAGGIAVPLALSHPANELAYVLDDCAVSAAISNPELLGRLEPLTAERNIRLDLVDPMLQARTAPPPSVSLSPDDGAMILYTSGTTGRPKGVVLSHGNIQAQVEALVAAWQWSTEDRILETLPLHHVHGLINIIACALWSGAVCEILPRFDATRIWDRIRSDELTLFMAVPTIYVKLIRAWEDADTSDREALSRAAGELRLMVSGSAALPVPVLDRWREITGQILLERYGMTEIGMALSNPYAGDRIPGAVGAPLPRVDLRLVDADGHIVAPGDSGEIEVRGPNVFREYWQRPEATLEAFRDGWFRTGDMAVSEDGVYRILGRQSVDIIKCGGEKISALEIETVLLAHPSIEECAVVGLEDPEWGQRVAAALVLTPGEALELEPLRSWAKERLAIFKVPSRIQCLDELPRNAMGKVTKPAVVKVFESAPDA